MSNVYKKLEEQYLETILKREGQQYDKENGAIFSKQRYVFNIDKDGNEVSNFAIHQVILNILNEFKRVCDKNNIPWAIGFGGALGLVNYKGFIPWDDDSDVVINLDDLPRLVEALKKDLGPDYAFDCYETDHRYNVLNPTMKIRYKHSLIKEKNDVMLPNKCKNGSGIFIDVAAFSNVPDNVREHRKVRARALWFVPVYVFLDTFLRIPPFLGKKSIKKYEMKVNEKYRHTGCVSQSAIIAWQAIGKDKTKIIYPKEMIYPFVEREFEGQMFPFFHDVEGFLKFNYGEKALKKFIDGEWRETYPEDKRHPAHIKRLEIYK